MFEEILKKSEEIDPFLRIIIHLDNYLDIIKSIFGLKFGELEKQTINGK